MKTEAPDTPARNFWHLVFLSLRLRAFRFAGLAAAVAFGVLALALALAVGLGPSRALQRHMQSIFPEQRMVLKPAAVDILFISLETGLITPQTLEAVKALPGVKRVSPEITVRFPLRAEGALFGMTYSTDLTVTGVEPWVLGDDLPVKFAWDERKDEWIPTVFSQYFLDLYNLALAESNGLPKLSRNAAIGRDFWVVLGESSIRPSSNEDKVRYEECRIVGLSDNPDLLGLVLPLEAVEEFNAWWGHKDKRFRALHVELESPEAAATVEAAADALGLHASDRQSSWRKAVLISRIAGSVIAAMGLLVLVLAGAYVLQATRMLMLSWKNELAIWRATGATLALVRKVVVTSFLLAGGFGSLAGIAAAFGLIAIGAHGYAKLEEQWSFLPPNAIHLPWFWAVPLVFIVALSMACMAFWQIRRLLRESVASVLCQNR